jgi:hypothetical protein
MAAAIDLSSHHRQEIAPHAVAASCFTRWNNRRRGRIRHDSAIETGRVTLMQTGWVIAILIGATLPAFADDGTVIVVPGRAGVPVVINGYDASYAMVEGDWGLSKNVHVQPTVYGGRRFYPAPVGHYYPSEGRMPGYGRYEVDTPPRQLPRAESYSRSWSAESQPTPQQDAIPYDPPPVVVAPRRRGPATHTPNRYHNDRDADHVWQRR